MVSVNASRSRFVPRVKMLSRSIEWLNFTPGASDREIARSVIVVLMSAETKTGHPLDGGGSAHFWSQPVDAIKTVRSLGISRTFSGFWTGGLTL
jgi:hypothetical protein